MEFARRTIDVTLRGSAFAGHGAEGIVFTNGDYAVKFWWSSNEHETSFHCWNDYKRWPAFVKRSLPKLIWIDDLYPPITVVEKVTPDNTVNVHRELKKAIEWLSRTYGYDSKQLLERPQLGRTNSGKVVLFDIA